MQIFFYRSLASLQAILERIARKSNGGTCETYNYCKYCKEPNCFNRKSETPCADAFLKSGIPYVFATCNWGSDGSKERARKYVLYGANLVNVKYHNPNTLEYTGRVFSYISDIPVRVGDIVKVPTRQGNKIARVCRTNVPVKALTCKIGGLRHIKERATIGGGLLNNSID